MKIKIMRGLPGSGKDTWIHQYLTEEHNKDNYLSIISADSKRMNDRGEYIYNKEQDANIHNECLLEYINIFHNTIQCINTIKQGPKLDTIRLDRFENRLIIVNNTNIRSYEFTSYYRIAEAYGHEVEIIWIVTEIEKCIARNIHNVPETTIRNMAASFDPVPPWWKLRIVTN